MATYETSGTLTTATKTADVAANEADFTVSVPTSTQVDVTIYQDTTGDGTTNNSDTLTDISSSTYSLSGFESVTGADYWAEFTLSTTDDSTTPSVDVLSVTLLDAPSTPQNLTSTVSQDDISLDWDAVSWNGDQGHYDIKRAQSTGGPYTEITTVASGTTTYTDSALEDGERFFYVVEADNSAGGSGNSNETNETAYLPAPSNLNATNS